MAFESTTIMTTTDPSKVAADLNDLVRPALVELGSLEVSVVAALTGPMTGMYALSNRWETLEAWSAAEATMAQQMLGGGELAQVAARYQTVQRVISRDLLEAGTCTGQYLNASRFSITSAPQGLEHAAKVMIDAGVNGVRALSVMAGGDMSGHLIGGAFVDSLDTLSDALAATAADDQFMADIAEIGAKLESRTIFRIL